MITENELGVEMTFLSDRVSLIADVYQQKLKDGIVYTNTASSSGFTSSLINAANTQTKGLEMELKTTVIKSKTVIWNVGINYTPYSKQGPCDQRGPSIDKYRRQFIRCGQSPLPGYRDQRLGQGPPGTRDRRSGYGQPHR